MWIRRSGGFNRNKLIVGCGHDEYFEDRHRGSHLQCDTLNLDQNTDPDILGSIIDPFIGPAYFNKYKFILVECIPAHLYKEDLLYENLNKIAAGNTKIIFTAVTSIEIQEIRDAAERYDWREPRELSGGNFMHPAFTMDETFLWQSRLWMLIHTMYQGGGTAVSVDIPFRCNFS